MVKKGIYEQTCYVVYIPGEGFVRNKDGLVTEDFSKCRIYSKKNYASSSINMNRAIQRKNAIVLPVHVSIDPGDLLFTEIQR